MNQDKIETITKLLAKAADKGVTEAEAEAYTAKATELMIKYGIDEAVLAQNDKLHQEKIIQMWVSVTGTYAPELDTLIQQAAMALGLTPYSMRMGGSARRVYFVGFKSDVEWMTLLATSLILQANTAMSVWWKKERPRYAGHTAMTLYKVRRSFFIGFGRTVRDRLAAQRMTLVEEAIAAAPGTDLVLASREDQIEAWVNEHLKLKTQRPKQYVKDGTAAGAVAGASANLGGTGVGDGASGKAIES